MQHSTNILNRQAQVNAVAEQFFLIKRPFKAMFDFLAYRPTLAALASGLALRATALGAAEGLDPNAAADIALSCGRRTAPTAFSVVSSNSWFLNWRGER